jgi:predicted negative regulator of RcsB-dependent stress response
MAIDDLLDEHEQGERVRSWLQRNALGLLGGVVRGLALIGGWRWWQAQQETRRVQTGEHYQAALKSLKANNLAQAQEQVAAIEDETYSTLAAFDLAKAQVGAGERDAAIATLRKANPSDPGLAQIRSQRLARLLIDAGKGREALQLLASADDAAGLEARGDAQLALGQHAEARKTYGQALAKVDVAAPQRRLLELKLSEVGGTPAQPKAGI